VEVEYDVNGFASWNENSNDQQSVDSGWVGQVDLLLSTMSVLVYGLAALKVGVN